MASRADAGRDDEGKDTISVVGNVEKYDHHYAVVKNMSKS